MHGNGSYFCAAPDYSERRNVCIFLVFITFFNFKNKSPKLQRWSEVFSPFSFIKLVRCFLTAALLRQNPEEARFWILISPTPTSLMNRIHHPAAAQRQTPLLPPPPSPSHCGWVMSWFHNLLHLPCLCPSHHPVFLLSWSLSNRIKICLGFEFTGKLLVPTTAPWFCLQSPSDPAQDEQMMHRCMNRWNFSPPKCSSRVGIIQYTNRFMLMKAKWF